jgi:hypothetical protein
VSRGRRLAAAALTALLAAPIIPARAEQPAPDGWRPFKATWTFSGTRQLLPTEGPRPSAIVHLQGPLVVTSGEGLGRGFLGEAFIFDDGGSLVVGRAVLTDGKGDRIYSSMKAEPVGTGRKATATITGGTGRYAGLEGTFTFSWQYVVSPDSGEIGGRVENIEGRTRLAPPSGREEPR